MAMAQTAPDRALGTLSRGMLTALIGLTLLALFAVSNLLLTRLGIEYDTIGGSPLEKIHPATYLALVTFAWFLVARADPVGEIAGIVSYHKWLLLFLCTWLFLLGDIAFVQKTPFTAIVDTFLLPMLLAVLLLRVNERSAHGLALLIHGLLLANALLALGEFIVGDHVTPLVANGVLLPEWRSTALIGHPLANAMVTGAYILTLLLGGGRDLPKSVTALIFLIQLAAMGVFGGRAALVLLALIASLVLAGRFLAILRGRRVSLLALALGVLAVPLLIIAITAAIEAGMLDRFAQRFVSDEGSAQTRLDMFVLLSWIPWRDLLFGPDPEFVASLQRIEGLEFGIESFWIAFVAYYGLLVSLPFFATFLGFLGEIWQATRRQSLWVIAFFLIVASTSASISGKTTVLAIFVAMILVLLRRPEPEPNLVPG